MTTTDDTQPNAVRLLPDTQKRWRIAWKSLETGYEGAGEILLSYEECKRICEWTNVAYPYMQHWPQAVETEEPKP
jgi:hypothetical protein